MMQIAQAANASLRGIQRSITTVVGNTIAISGIITSDGGVNVLTRFTFTGSSGPVTIQPCNFTTAITRGFFYQEFTVPAATTSGLLDFIVAAGTGICSIGQITILDLTAMGALVKMTEAEKNSTPTFSLPLVFWR
jgi:hypothetical protein